MSSRSAWETLSSIEKKKEGKNDIKAIIVKKKKSLSKHTKLSSRRTKTWALQNMYLSLTFTAFILVKIPQDGSDPIAECNNHG